MNNTIQQIPLHFAIPAHHQFDDFLPGENELTVDLLRHFSKTMQQMSVGGVFLSGAAGTGKTHLLLALCQDDLQLMRYLPLRRLNTEQITHLLQNLEPYTAVCIDDVECIIGQRGLEIALFDAFNQLRDRGAHIICASQITSQNLNFSLPDLGSRLRSLMQLNLKPLSEENRKIVLKKYAQARGWELDLLVLDYLFRHHSRDLHTLLSTLQRLDHASLAAQRRVTVPFLRQLLATGLQ